MGVSLGAPWYGPRMSIEPTMPEPTKPEPRPEPRPEGEIRWFLRPANAVFDAFERVWDSDTARRSNAWIILLGFVGTGAWIGLSRLGVLPESLLLQKPFGYAIHTAFTLVLITEVVTLILSLSRSVAESVGKQFEIFSLILLRQAFEEFSHRGDSVEWVFAWDSPVTHMISDIAGAIAVFSLVTVYAKLQLHRPITSDPDEQRNFVAAKKGVALILLAAFVVLSVFAGLGYIGRSNPIPLFKSFYVTLIFADVLIVLLAMRYSASHAIVFRNAGFAASTLLLRVALSAPPFLNAGIGLASAGLLIALAAAYRHAIVTVNGDPQQNMLR